MNWKCFFFGCRWRHLMTREERGELLTTHFCQRCNSMRTTTE